MKNIIFLVSFLSFNSFTASFTHSLDVYPAGIINDLGLKFNLGAKSSFDVMLGFNKTKRNDWGECSILIIKDQASSSSNSPSSSAVAS